MGIPKFFHFISERWPQISQLIDGSQIPEFDNLYLDMNSILHNCTHGDGTEVNSKLSEEDVYSRIFSYIDHLFHTIKPKQTFFMAIDGVAPRAKMNQQRARRFRTAMDAEKAMQKAIENGDELPKGEPFDSNAITPGTEFMARLTDNLKYFIHDKISNDTRWQNVQVIFSGHEVPGEGEHKIMDYIRAIRAQDDYNPNTRHCIYGLDADLIILGLSTHDHHFSLLREEVTFGKRSSSVKTLESQNFYLLHLSILREYLELEFQEITDVLQFDYDFERVLDDFIFVLFTIGNDFLPNLPDLHLKKGAFPVLLQTFKEALQHMDGYINEQGKINLARFSIWLKYLSDFEYLNFEKKDIDVNWFNQQLENISLEGERKRQRMGKRLLMKQQKKLIGAVKPWLLKSVQRKMTPDVDENDIEIFPLEEKEVVLANLDFLKEFAFNLGLILAHSQSKDMYYFKLDLDSINMQETDEEHEARIHETRRSIKKYEQGVVIASEEELEEEREIYSERFVEWKDKYYKDKLEFSIKDTDKLKEMTENYVEGLQWVLYYYYRGCPSWSWYYRYHYAPRISDIIKGIDQKIEFEKGTPFKPFQQLMAVLPERSKNLIPVVYRPLMYDEHSPILDFYPNEVELDLNGKTADWEAVVKISFVDQKRLIEAMAPYDAKLSPEEKKRNSFGTDLIFIFNPQVDTIYKTPLSGFFNDIEHNHCIEREFITESPENIKFLFGLPKGAKLGASALAGFPSLKTVPLTAGLEYNSSVVFNFPSKQQSMVLHIQDVFKENHISLSDLAKRHIGKVIYSRWPYLRESKLLSIITEDTIYESISTGKTSKLMERRPQDFERKEFRELKHSLKSNYQRTKAVILDDVYAVAKVIPVNGLVRNQDGSYSKSFSDEIEFYPLQLIVEDVENKDERFAEKEALPIDKEFPEGSKVVFLGDYAYGGEATIDGYNSATRLKLTVKKSSIRAEPNIGKVRAKLDSQALKYYSTQAFSKITRVHPLFLSKITSRYLVVDSKKKSYNVGLMIKFKARNQKVLGYARCSSNNWEYSDLARGLLEQFRSTFPEFFIRLSNSKEQAIPSITDIFSDKSPAEADAILKSVADWVSEARKPFVVVSLESDSLTKASMAAVESEIIKYVSLPDSTEEKKLAKVPREAILNAESSYVLLRSQRFHLGDRVMYIQASGKVPLHSKGTVVGYTTIGKNVSIQVLFDNEIVAGNNFGGRLQTRRGLGLDSSFLLNLSDRQLIYHSKASKDVQKKSTTTSNSKQSMLAKKKKVEELKKKQAHELLNHIKKDNGKEENGSETSGQTGPQISVNALNPSAASNVFNAVLNQIQPVMQHPIPQPPPGTALPYNFPVPPSMMVNGVAPPHMMPPQFLPNGQPMAPIPVPQYSQAPKVEQPVNEPAVDEEASRSLKNLLLHDDHEKPSGKSGDVGNSSGKPTRGRGGNRGRGNNRGRGGSRGGKRGGFSRGGKASGKSENSA